MKRLPLGIQTFPQIIEENMVYVDKSDYISRLVTNYKYVFLSRPRRFGKSLFLSTLDSFFNGRSELFQGLAIQEKLNGTPNSFPVIKLDFSAFSSDETSVLVHSIKKTLMDYGEQYSLDMSGLIEHEYLPTLIRGIYKNTGKRVVILVDEYDKPIVDFLDKPEIAEGNREVLRRFYSTIKSLDDCINFMFITGVTRFSKVSLFSGLNQITDISLLNEFAGICGYTQSELELHFDDRIDRLSVQHNTNRDTISINIRKWYNGYSWDGELRVYNPVSILNLFNSGNFGNFWYQTGTPNFLAKFVQKEKFDITERTNLLATPDSFDSEDLSSINFKSFLFQTGYLTIKEKKMIDLRGYYELGLPNLEVEESFYKYLFSSMTDLDSDVTGIYAGEMKVALRKGDYETFTHHIRHLFARIPSNLYIAEERYFHSLFIMIATLTGIETDSEVNTNIGRIDGVLEFEDKVYLLEFNLTTTAEAAIEPIVTKKHAERETGKQVVFIGMNFTRENIDISFVEK